ncbi:MAG: hypothetical protein ACTHKE_09820 [Sphingomicrobium sp.]
MTGWRVWALGLGGVIAVGGLFVWRIGAGPMVVVFGALMMLTAALEPIYGRANGRPIGGRWRPTDERFVDPESGELVTVWFDPASGERRYVADKPGSSTPR